VIDDVYDICVNGVSNIIERRKLNSVRDIVIIDSKRYDMYANDKKLFILQPLTSLYYGINQDDIKKLYTNQLVPKKKKKGREIYDKIMSLAYLNKCPFCGIGVVSTLDHYLPKSEFPIYAVFPYNLVPSCKDCNTGKSASFAIRKDKQTLHPYYDDLTREQWLFATVVDTYPLSIKFFVNPPYYWDFVSKARVKAHFIDYDLAKRFSIEASNELAKLNSSFSIKEFNFMQIKGQLIHEERTYKNIHLNSWESALYQALAESDWYCREGYKQGVL